MNHDGEPGGGNRGKRGSLICRLQVSNDLVLRTKQSLTGDFVDCWQCIECWANEITSHQNRSTESVHRNFDLNGHVKPIAPRQLELYLAWIYYKSPRISCQELCYVRQFFFPVVDGGNVPKTVSQSVEVMPKPLSLILKWWLRWYRCIKGSWEESKPMGFSIEQLDESWM